MHQNIDPHKSMHLQFPEIAQELIQLAELDQKMRKSASFDIAVDNKNTSRLKEIVDQIGWPTIAKVGDAASYAAWLLAQHADLNVEFQELALSLMKLSPPNQVRPDCVAYLEDRVRVNRDLPQLYGTQGRHSDGIWQPLPIERESEVDERRAQVGLILLADYIKLMNDIIKNSKI